MLFTTAPVSVQAAQTTAIEIDQENFPDNIFRTYIRKFDKNQDGVLSASERKAVKKIEVKKSGIRSLDGISYFTRLTELDCSGNKLTSLSLSKNTRLTELDCSDNNLTGLNVSKNTKLEELDCSENQLRSLNVSSNTGLEELDCHSNRLTILNVSSNTNLEELDCHDNRLTKLDLSKNDKLKAKDFSCDKDVTVKR
jgi:Leucine-rich repeat (LRR) protein